jgi:CheY-like chemotaxis protein
MDHDPANNKLDNLVYLCLRHHDLYDTTQSQSKGITIGELKHYRNELYRNLGTDRQLSELGLEHDQIRLCDSAVRDCETLAVSAVDLVTFILQEASRHPLLFGSPFMSLPLVFRDNVLLISWDCYEVRVERLLNRQEAYPLNDSWASCLALYRKATLLPYRTNAPGHPVTRTEGQRAIKVYRKLISETNNFLDRLKENKQNPPQTYLDLSALVDEAEFSLGDGDNGKLVSHLEAVLSTVHKLILNCAPQGVMVGTIAPMEAPPVEVPNDNKCSILIVDDQKLVLDALGELLSREGYAVTSANTTTDALRAMVEHEFDMVITDLVMPVAIGAVAEADGREVAIAAKRSSEKTKVIVLTAFMEMSHIAELFKLGVDDVISKVSVSGSSGLVAKIRDHLGSSTKI